MSRVAILNSRQSKTPVGNDPWVSSTLAAVDYAAENGWTIVSSIGLNTWELVTWAAGRRGMRLQLVCPEDVSTELRAQILNRFGLHSTLVEWREVARGRGRSLTKNWWEERDTEIVSAADILLPVSIRRGGRMDSLLTLQADKDVDEKFRIRYSSFPHHVRGPLLAVHFSPNLLNWPDGWLIHWTRACHGPWPGENDSDYYADLAASTDSYCRSALTTICRILTERQLRGSAWRIGSGVPMVALTELSPFESLKLMRWRSRWSRWSFEPYGIAVARDATQALGGRPVCYVDEMEWKTLADEERPFSHCKGEKAGFWTAEREWRCRGDLDLATFPDNAVRAIVRTKDEADRLQQEVSCEVLTMFE